MADFRRAVAKQGICGHVPLFWTPFAPPTTIDAAFASFECSKWALRDSVVMYKVDRLSRSLLDFTRLWLLFDKRGVSFVSVKELRLFSTFSRSNPLSRFTLWVIA